MIRDVRRLFTQDGAFIRRALTLYPIALLVSPSDTAQLWLELMVAGRISRVAVRGDRGSRPLHAEGHQDQLAAEIKATRPRQIWI